jgi:polyhydroxybutyrate depolymerase
MTDQSINNALPNWVRWGQRFLLLVGLLGLFGVLVLSWFKPPLPEVADNTRTLPKGCEDHPRGQAGRDMDRLTAGGLRFAVVAPKNYQPDQQHGLLMVFPPAGFSRDGAERFYGLTAQAHRHGFVVVYSDAIPLSTQALRLQSEVVPWVMAHWCIDPNRLVLAGHSDGGSVSAGLALRFAKASVTPSHLVISAAGIQGDDLQKETCPAPMQVNILHSPKDERFPNYGASTVAWWSRCMQCTESIIQDESGCTVRSCTSGKQLRYCPTQEPHAKWPAVASKMWDWLE